MKRNTNDYKWKLVWRVAFIAVASLFLLACNTEATTTPTATPTTAVDVLDEAEDLVRVDVGGYAFRNLFDYPAFSAGGSVSLAPPNADPALGPAFFLIGELFDGEQSLSDSLFELTRRFAEEDATIGEPVEVSLNDVTGLQADFEADLEGQSVSGRIVVFYPYPNQRFAMFSFAPTASWEQAILTNFEQLLETVVFFEATPIDNELDLSQPLRIERGGFVFQPLPNYQLDLADSRVLMMAPDADPDAGPMLLLFGGPASREVSAEQIMTGLYETFNTETSSVGEPDVMNLDGVVILMSSITGEVQGVDIRTRVAVAKVTPEQSFTMIGISPPDRWESELLPAFEQVLNSLELFELR